ncbi:MAG: hypothetical protein M3N37_07245 [Actinomycetota bacterium]|nr:hypothetical protein [Actinomycetota bacterium]
MTHYLWPGDPGWPMPEADRAAEPDVSDPAGEIDLDAVCLHADRHLLDDLSPLERTVVCARFGLDGTPERSMKQLHRELGLTRHQVRELLESGLVKLRAHLAA